MKQLYKTNIGLRVEEVPISTPGDNEILVKIYNSLISTGTEIGSFRKKEEMSLRDTIDSRMQQAEKVFNKINQIGLKPTLETLRKKLNPSELDLIYRPIGYSNSGIIIETGKNATQFNVGDRVACAGSGIAAHAEYAIIPINLAAKIPDTLAFDKASFTTVASIVLHGIRRAKLQPGETVAIVGLGLLGLIAIQIAKAYGYIVFGLDIQNERMELAATLGADYIINPQGNFSNEILNLTDDHGVDASIIFASSSDSGIINSAMKYTRRKGRIVAVGSVGMDIEREEMYKKEIDLLMSTSYGPGRYDDNYEVKGLDYPYPYVRWTENRNMKEVIRLLDQGFIKTEVLVNGVFKIEEAPSAYKALLDRQKGFIGVLFQYHAEDLKEKIATKIFTFSKPQTDNGRINVAIVGAGGFANRTHLPNLAKLNELFHIRAISDKVSIDAKVAGKRYNSDYVTTNYNDIIEDKDIDLVIIATRHNLHAEIAMQALLANKHVLVEKPLAINKTEFNRLIDVAKNSKGIIRVGFNRRYSPLIKKIASIIEPQKHPISINYRINAGYLPKNHWTQDLEIGGGRIIGEFCHFLDLSNFLADSDVVKLDVVNTPVNDLDIQNFDNIGVNIMYKNGSFSQISYISYGGKNLPKERLEISTNGMSLVIEDFKDLRLFNTSESDISLKKSDKGHFNELLLLGQYIRNPENQILPFENDIRTTELVFTIQDILNGHQSKY